MQSRLVNYLRAWDGERAVKNPPLVIQKLREILHDDAQVVEVMEAVDSICPRCWDDELPCHCENDE